MRTLFIVRDVANAEPLGLMQLAAVLKQAGHEVRLAGARVTPLAPLMDAFRPHVVGYTACTGLHRYLLQLNRGLKRRWKFVSIFGGPHATFFPQMIEQDGVDVVCRGEGEGAILDIATAFRTEFGDGEPDRLERTLSAFADIPNLWVKLPRGIVRNGLRPLIDDLDALPWPDREVRYDADPPSRAYPVKSFLVSRGCPFRCSYCFNAGYADLYGQDWMRVRTRSVANVIAEIRRVAADGPLELLQFRESVFPWQEEWLAEFAGRYRAEVGLPFYCHVRADLLNERVVELLARAGCVSVNMGIECGDEDYRRRELNRPMSNEQIIAACRMLHERGIRILADNMIGLPGAGPDVDEETLALNRACKADYPLAMLFQPYPGTELGRRAVELGAFDGDFDRIDYNYYLRSPLRFDSEERRRHTESLHKWFAILVEAPWLDRLIRPLLNARPNLAFLCIFRAWYTYCYVRRIVPHRVGWAEWRELWQTLFGIFPREANRELVEQGS